MYCPSCRFEYRPEFTVCKNCNDMALVEELQALETFTDADLEDARAVGITERSDVTRLVEVEGGAFDLLRVFLMDDAVEHRRFLEEIHSIPAVVVPLTGVAFPDHRERFQVCVRAKDFERAERLLYETWRGRVEGQDTLDPASLDADKCPACGTEVPMASEECPECGLVVGVGEPDEAPEV